MVVLNCSRYLKVYSIIVYYEFTIYVFIAFWSYSKDVHTELIQHKRAWMIKRGIVKGKLSVDSAEQRLAGLCPLMPEEVSRSINIYGF